MKWYKKLYIAESLNFDFETIISEISVNPKLKKCYFITLPANDKNLLDIINVKWALNVNLREIYILGITSTKKEAVNLVAEILSKLYINTNDLNIKEYFNDFI